MSPCLKNLSDSTTYYPYGEPTIEPRGQRFLFGGKEREHAAGRNTYDFGARNLAANAWTTPDPLAEKFYPLSPYSYCGGDPINRVDPDGKRQWPVDNPYKGKSPVHSNNFGDYRGGNHPHGGVDINIGRGNYDLGAPVYATHDGTIVRLVSSPDGNGGGIRISLKSPGGEIKTSYMHLDKTEATLKLGQSVSEGQKIGYIGNTGQSKGAHLHYEIEALNKNGEFEKINPAKNSVELKDAQNLVNKTVFSGSELQGVEVVGQSKTSNNIVPLLNTRVSINTDEIQIIIKSDLN